MESTKEERIAQAERIKQFVEDAVVNDIISKLERKYYEEFKKARSADERVTTWAKAVVLEDFLTSMSIRVNDGKLARRELETESLRQRNRREGRPMPGE